MDPTQPPDGAHDTTMPVTSVSQQRLRRLVAFEYRSTALRRLGVSAEWRILDWVNAASCTDCGETIEATCSQCPVVAECLAAAVATADPAEWRGGLSRADRERLWTGGPHLPKVRDLEFMRFDNARLADRYHHPRPPAIPADRRGPKRSPVMTDTSRLRDELRSEAIQILTQAARQTTDRGEQADFADFLTCTLVATAANLGGPDQLLSRRPGSWKASYLFELLSSAVNWEGSYWAYRTEPLLIPLNVAEIVGDRHLHPGLVTLDDAIEIIDRRYIGVEETEAVLDAWTAEVEALSDRYEAEFKLYVERFAVAAHLYGRALTPPVDVRVIADTSASPRWWDDTRVTNPIDGDGDPLAIAIWQLTHDTVALPNIDARARETATRRTSRPSAGSHDDPSSH